MSNDPFVVTPPQIDTRFQDMAGYPLHNFNLITHEQPRQISFDSIWSPTNNLIIVRDTIFEGTAHVPCSLKISSGPVLVAAFFMTTNFSYGSNYNIDLTAVADHPPFIGVPAQRIPFTDWRLRAIWRTRGILSGQVLTGSSFGNRVLQDLKNQLTRTVDGKYFLTPDHQVGDRPFPVYWQVELGYKGRTNALDTALRLTAGSDWPAWTQTITDDPRS